MPGEGVDDAQVVEKVLGGDRQAFAALIDRYQNLVFGYLASRRGDPDVAEELVQEAFVEAYTHLRQLRDRGQFGSWLYGIARNLSNQWFARHKRESDARASLAGNYATGLTPEQEMERDELSESVWAAVAQLPDASREAILLHYASGMSGSEIAAFVGVSASAIRSRLQYGRERLRDLMESTIRDEIGSRRLGHRSRARIMAALPLVALVPSRSQAKPAILLGLTGKELLMSAGWFAVTAGTLVWLSVRAPAQIGGVADPDTARQARLASAQEQALLQSQLATGGQAALQGYLDETPDHAPLTRLIRAQQEGRGSPYTITGFPGCAESGAELVLELADGTRRDVGVAADDGSFRFTVEHDRAQAGISVRARDASGHLSEPAVPRLDYPMMALEMQAPNERGWKNLTTVAIGRERDLAARREHWERYVAAALREQAWLQDIGLTPDDYFQAAQDRTAPERPDSVAAAWERVPGRPVEAIWKIPRPEDLLLYGEAAGGAVVTCIITATGASVASPVMADGSFEIVIPAAIYAIGDEGFSTIVSVTDGQNHLLVSHGDNTPAPMWAREESRLRRISQLIGEQAPQLKLASIADGSVVDTRDLHGHPTLLVVWATWCAPCLVELDSLQLAYLELQRRGLQVYTVAAEQTSGPVRRLLTEKRYGFPVLLDSTAAVNDGYGLYAIPRTTLVGADGRVEAIWTGAMGSTALLDSLAMLGY